MDQHMYRVRLSEQATLHAYLNNLRNRVPAHFRRPEPCLLQLEDGEERTLSRFFKWNFGHTHWNHFAIRDHGVRGCRPPGITDAELLELLYKERALAWPVHVCSDAPLRNTAGDSWRREFPIFYGEGPHTLIAYWNDGLTSGKNTPILGPLKQIWLTKSQFEDKTVYPPLAKLLRTRVYANDLAFLKIISFESEQEELDRLGKQLCNDIRSNIHYRGCAITKPSEIKYEKPRKIPSFVQEESEVHYATGRSIRVPVHPPTEVSKDENQLWMADLRIFNPEQRLWAGNANPWWQLPRNPSVANLFNRYKPKRVTASHDLSFEVSTTEALLHLQLPGTSQLFQTVLSPTLHVVVSNDGRSTLSYPPPREVLLSDKGMYAKGILKLTSPLRQSLYLFEHPFWRSIFLRLSKPEAPRQVLEKLGADVQETLQDLRFNSDADKIRAWLAEEIAQAARQLERAELSITFKDLQEKYVTYLGNMDTDRRGLADSDLRPLVSELTKDEILLQGSSLQCPRCISSFWYPVAAIEKWMICRGCHANFPLPAETEWSYRLNELISVGIRDHGILALIRTLARIFGKAEDCFFYTPSVKFVRYTEDYQANVDQELDLAWIMDGALGIAEVKTTSNSFRKSDYEDLAKLAQIVQADTVLIAATDGDDNDLFKGKELIQEKLGPTVQVRAIGPTEFAHIPHWVI
jgi:hypothetical protein